MFKERLIESFTWLFMEVEILIMEGISPEIIENKIYNEFTKSAFYTVLCYLCDINYTKKICKEGNIDYDETLDYLLNLSQQEKVTLNCKVMKDYSENDILKLIEDTVKLIQLLKIIE